MKKGNIIFIYGFFLVWLLSFLYNGPLLKLLFKEGIKYLELTYILVPALFSLIYSMLVKEKRNDLNSMKISLAICFIGTVLILFMPINRPSLYIIAGTLGIASVVFISGWGFIFANNIKLSNMIRIMGLTICLGKGLFTINHLLSVYGFKSIIIAIILLSLIIAYYFTYHFSTHFSTNKGSLSDDCISISIDYSTLIILVSTMFLINISGGFILAFVSEGLNTSPIYYSLDLIIYILSFIAIIIIKRIDFNYTLGTSALVALGVGLILFILLPNATPISYFITTAAFLIIDILLWSTVGTLGYITQRPYKIFFASMGANLLSVILGNLLYMLLKDLSIAISICSLFVFTSFLFCQLLHSKTSNQLVIFNDLNGILVNIDLDIFTEKEKEIIILMCQNLKNREIADHLYISENTLKTHAKNIYSKLGVKNKRELVKLNTKQTQH